MTEQRNYTSLLEAQRRLDEALSALDEAEHGGATVVRIGELRAALTGQCVTVKRAS